MQQPEGAQVLCQFWGDPSDGTPDVCTVVLGLGGGVCALWVSRAGAPRGESQPPLALKPFLQPQSKLCKNPTRLLRPEGSGRAGTAPPAGSPRPPHYQRQWGAPRPPLK